MSAVLLPWQVGEESSPVRPLCGECHSMPAEWLVFAKAVCTGCRIRLTDNESE